MKRVVSITAIMLLGAALAWAQAPAAQPKPQPAAQAPATPAPANQAAAAQPPAPRRMPAAKTQEELAAYQAAQQQIAQTQDGAAAEKAAEEFALKYPESELRSVLYQQLLGFYQAANNAEKTVAMGRKVIAVDPDSPVALVLTATVLAERTRESDLDRDEKLGEAQRYARHALETVDTMPVPPNAPPDRVAAAKKMVVSMAYSALGSAESAKENHAGAEKLYKQSIEAGEANPDPLTYLRLAITLDKEQKYAEGLAVANRALEIATAQQTGPQVIAMARQQRDRLAKLAGSVPAPAPAPGTPPAKPQPPQ